MNSGVCACADYTATSRRTAHAQTNLRACAAILSKHVQFAYVSKTGFVVKRSVRKR